MTYTDGDLHATSPIDDDDYTDHLYEVDLANERDTEQATRYSPILTGALAELQDNADHLATTTRRALKAALDLNLNPTVTVEGNGEFIRVTWSKVDLGKDREVEVLTFWSNDDPTPTTAIDLNGDFQDEYADASDMIRALTAAETLRNRVADLIH